MLVTSPLPFPDLETVSVAGSANTMLALWAGDQLPSPYLNWAVTVLSPEPLPRDHDFKPRKGSKADQPPASLLKRIATHSPNILSQDRESATVCA